MGDEVKGELRRMVGGLVVMNLGGVGLEDEGMILNLKARAIRALAQRHSLSTG